MGSVLSELDAADAAHLQEAEHEHRLASLNDLAKEQNASAEALKATFEAELQKGSERRSLLLEEQTNLTNTKQAAIELNERLKVALNHLQETGSDLSKQKESIKSFLWKVGSSPEAEQAETKVAFKQEAKTSTPAKIQKKKQHEKLSLASAGQGKVVKEVMSGMKPKDDSAGKAQARGEQKHVKK